MVTGIKITEAWFNKARLIHLFFVKCKSRYWNKPPYLTNFMVDCRFCYQAWFGENPEYRNHTTHKTRAL